MITFEYHGKLPDLHEDQMSSRSATSLIMPSVKWSTKCAILADSLRQVI